MTTEDSEPAAAVLIGTRREQEHSRRGSGLVRAQTDGLPDVVAVAHTNGELTYRGTLRRGMC